MLNNVTVMGRLTADPALYNLPNGDCVARFRIAVRRRPKNNKSGRQTTDFFSVSVWNKQAEWVVNHFKKSQFIIVKGHLESFDRPAVDGTTRSTLTEIVAEEIFLEPPLRTFSQEKSQSTKH